MKEEKVIGKYSVPEEIRKLKPKGTMVKAFGEKYYVYEHFCVKVDGKWKTKMGKMIGQISLELGFVPNDNYKKEERLTSFDFGQYFITYKLGMPIYEKLKEFFDPEEAAEIYLLSILHFTNGFTYAKYIKPRYDMSYLSKRFPSISLSEYKVMNLFEKLGHYTEKVENFEQMLINESSKKIAVDGHAIKTSSKNNDLAEKGNKCLQFKDSQMNVLMAYDIKNNRPLFSRIYPGSSMDAITFKDVFQRFEFKNTLFVIDKGFNSKENLSLCSKNGNKYVVPMRGSSNEYKKLIKNANFKEAFVYKKDKKNTAIYFDCKESDGKKVIIYKDFTAAVLESNDYESKIGKNDKYTKKNFNKLKDTFGIIILESNLKKSAEEIYNIYKNRWKIETFYNYYKNQLEVDSTYVSDYYRAQGLSFVLLVTSLIHSEFVSKIKVLNMNVTDVLIDTQYTKVHFKNKGWEFENLCKKHFDLYKKLDIDIYDELKFLNNLPQK